MARTTVPLRIEHLDQLHAPCRDCLFWEREPVHRHGLSAAQRRAEKAAWFDDVRRAWGAPGRTLVVDGEPVGYLAYAPAAFLPGAAAFPTAPVSGDAVLLTTGYLAPTGSGAGSGAGSAAGSATAAGLGRVLVQAMARDLLNRDGVRAVEAFGRAPLAPPTTPGGTDCVLPLALLHDVGFHTHRPHPFTPRLRMDLRSAVTWRDEVEAVWHRVAGVVRPRRAPAPATSTVPSVAAGSHLPRHAESPRT